MAARCQSALCAVGQLASSPSAVPWCLALALALGRVLEPVTAQWRHYSSGRRRIADRAAWPKRPIHQRAQTAGLGASFSKKGKEAWPRKKKIPGSPTPSGSCQGCRSCRPITGQACLVAVKAPTRAPIGPARGGVVPWSGKDLGEPSLCRPTGQMREHETLALCPLSAKRAAKSKWECPSTTTPHNTPQCPSATADLSLGCSPELPSEVERNTSGAGRLSRRETRRLLGRPGPPPPWLPLGPVASPKARVQLPPSSTTSPKILPWERQGWGLAR